MPNYDYACSECGHEFTDLLPIDRRDEPESKPCPNCGKTSIKRGVSAVKLSYSGFKSALSRTDGGWNEVLTKVKKGSGRKNTIATR